MMGWLTSFLSPYASAIRIGLLLLLGVAVVTLAIKYRAAIDQADLMTVQLGDANKEAAENKRIADANQQALVEETAVYEQRIQAADKAREDAEKRAEAAGQRRQEIKDAPVSDDRPVGPLLGHELDELRDATSGIGTAP